jgi:hypothetical protein
MEVVGDIERPLWDEAQWEQFERERVAQREAWERGWRQEDPSSDKGTTRPPSRRGVGRAGPGKARGRR